ncbi:aminotransferase class III-fold pyridoxal phosphate-dependent enzyme [Taklimakanibacter deserti]|uniref:aminotransferase class III-fold pyridoxal phosphate-dependent enzyme n=1 Tax=Taklimakanibacter deserti TaxID=2267839 RepID=UPI000E655741
MTTSAELFERACRHIPGGVNSPVRAFKGMQRPPVFMERAQGAYLFDVEGKRYVDYVGSWGPMITGHADPDVLGAVRERLDRGLSFGTTPVLVLRFEGKSETALERIKAQFAAALARVAPELDVAL